MNDLYSDGRYRQPGKLVLDVRSRVEYGRGHVPGSRNIPVSELERSAQRYRRELESFDEIFVHCSSGHRAKRAYEALRRTGLDNLIYVRDSGMPEWVRLGYPIEREVSVSRDLVTGMAAGLVGNVAVSLVDAVLTRLVSEEHKRRERRVREGSPHEVGGKRIGEKLAGRTLSATEKREAQIAFTVAYGVLFGALHALTRRRAPRATSLMGLAYGAGFFLACDGLLAPLFRMTPGLRQIPWQFNAKELTNHIAWTAAAELAHRFAERLALEKEEAR
jgi:rhodanese-related sulfurtransferase